MQYNLGPKTFTTDGAVKSKRLVKLSSGEVAHCTATNTDEPIGVTCYAAADGDEVAVDLLCEGRTFEIETSSSVSVGDDVFADADGKIETLPSDDSDEHKQIGIALEEASGSGSIIEVLAYDFHNTETGTQ